MQYPAVTEHTFDTEHLMRSWAQDGFLVELYDTGYCESSHTSVAYRLYDFEYAGETSAGLVFEGTDYGVPSSQVIDGDEAVRGLLGFLSCRPGDVDDDFFADYTPHQLAWAADRAEALSWWAMDDIDMETGNVPDDNH